MCRSFRFGIALTLAIEPAVFARPIITGPIITLLPWAVFTRTILPRAVLAVFALPVITGTIITGTIITRPVITLAVLTRTLFAFFTGPLFTRALLAGFPLLARWGAVECSEIALDAEVVAVVFAVLFLPAFTVRTSWAGTLIFQADPAVGDHTEIVVCKLEVVFGLHAITVEMSVLCELAILLEHLGGIAP